MSISAILFDADGVVQLTRTNFVSDMKGLVEQSHGDEFLKAVFESELPALTGKADFRTDLKDVLEHWNVKADTQAVLAFWYQIDVVDGLGKLLADCREQDVKVCLATNQQKTRMDYMRQTQCFDELFDHSFYSCDLGFVKPDPGYFESIVTSLGLPAEDLLFIDDNHGNVKGASSVGLNAEHFELPSIESCGQLRHLIRRWLPNLAE